MMKKGISTIIAAIILVVITIGLIATAYLYFAGIVSVGPVVAIASAYCDDTNLVKISIRNDGTSDLTADDIKWLVDGSPTSPTSGCSGSINPGESVVCEFQMAGDALYDLKAIGPRNQAGGPVQC